MPKITRNFLVFFLLFLLVTFPFVLTLFLPGTYKETNFSIYNEGNTGLSEFLELLMNPTDPNGGAAKQVEVRTLVSSTNALLRLDQIPAALILMGPTLHFDPSESLALLTYLAAGGRVLIVDDFGTGNDLLMLLNMILEYFRPFEMIIDSIQSTGSASGGGGDLGGTAGLEGLMNILAKVIGLNFGAGRNGSLLLDVNSYLEGPAQPVFLKSNVNETAIMYADTSNPIYANLPAFGISGEVPVSSDVFPSADNPISVSLDGTVLNPLLRTGSTYWIDVDQVLGNFATGLFLTLDDDGQHIPWPIPAYLSILASSEYFYMERDIASAADPNGRPEQDVGEFAGTAGKWAQTTGTMRDSFGNPIFYQDPEFTTPFVAYMNITVKGSTFFTLPLGSPNSDQTGSLTLCSDPSIFSNAMINKAGYDNRAFARNVIWELLYGRFQGSGDNYTSTTFGNSWLGKHNYSYSDIPIVVIDEAHLAHDAISPMLFLGFYLRFLDLLTMFPLLAPMIPILVVLYSRKFMPKRATPKPILLTKVERYYGRSFFAIKMRWFLEYQQFARGLELLNRRFRRRIVRYFSYDGPLDPQSVTRLFINEFKELNEKEILNGLLIVDNIVHNSLTISEEEFLSWHLFLKGLSDRIS